MAIENGVNYSLRLIKPILQGEATSIDVKPDAEEQYTDQIQKDLKATVWFSGCNSWYNRAQDGTARNAMAYPHSQAYLWYQCLFPVYKNFKYDVSWPSPSSFFFFFLFVAFLYNASDNPNTPWQVAKNPPRKQLWKKVIRYSIYAASLSGLGLVVSGRKNGWDLSSYMPFLKDQASVLRNGLTAYVKL